MLGVLILIILSIFALFVALHMASFYLNYSILLHASIFCPVYIICHVKNRIPLWDKYIFSDFD